MTSYYTKKLSAERLQRCYDIASPRVRQYLEAEIQHVLSRLGGADRVLELGCGYGRIALRMAEVAAEVVGIDVSPESLEMARVLAGADSRCEFLQMDALELRFDPDCFDVVVCLQNGMSAFGADKAKLLREAWRVLRPGGRILLSTYTDTFWPHRLSWFEDQSGHGLLGPIDHAASRDGVIVCTDGFRSGRVKKEEYELLCAAFNAKPEIFAVDDSSLWCEFGKPAVPALAHDDHPR